MAKLKMVISADTARVMADAINYSVRHLQGEERGKDRKAFVQCQGMTPEGVLKNIAKTLRRYAEGELE